MKTKKQIKNSSVRHGHKRTNHKQSQAKGLKTIIGRWSMGGYSSVRYFGLIFAGVLAISATIGVAYLQSRGSTIRQPLDAFSNSPNKPDVNELARYVNQARKLNGLHELQPDIELTHVAEERLRDMVNRQYYSHQDLSGKYYYDLFEAHGFTTGYSCENLDLEFSVKAKSYYDNWQKSDQGHRECMLHKDVTKVGYASGLYNKPGGGQDNEQVYLVVAIFAAPPIETTDQNN